MLSNPSVQCLKINQQHCKICVPLFTATCCRTLCFSKRHPKELWVEMKTLIAFFFFFLSLLNCVSILHYALYSLPFWHSQLPVGALWRSRLASRCNRHQLPKPRLLMSHIACMCLQAHRRSSYAISFQTAGEERGKCAWSVSYKNNAGS